MRDDSHSLQTSAIFTYVVVTDIRTKAVLGDTILRFCHTERIGGEPMSVNVSGVQLPAGATVDVKIDVTAQANITAFVAQQEVTSFVISKIGNQLCGDTPQLHIGERLCWSVPVILTSPANGVVGRVGEIIVDANTGELLVEADTVERIIARCEWLAQRSPL